MKERPSKLRKMKDKDPFLAPQAGVPHTRAPGLPGFGKLGWDTRGFRVAGWETRAQPKTRSFQSA